MPHFLRIALVLLLSFSSAANALVVLQYHHISDETPRATSTPPELFEQHLEYLAENDFQVIGLDQLARLIRSGKALPDKTAVITFDDGYISVFEEAYPRLRKYDFPFAVFINTEPHNENNPQFMSWQQMRKMAERGVVFANHTVTHPHMIRQLEGETASAWRSRIWREIELAEVTIEQKLKQSHKLLAYPFGEYNADVKKLLADNDYLAFSQQSGPLGQNSDKQALPRFPFGGVYGSLDDFATKMNTLPMPLQRVTTRSEKGESLKGPELPLNVTRPLLVLQLAQPSLAADVNCFASGQGPANVTVKQNQLLVQAQQPLPIGRSRYNCTAASDQKGRFYWYSEMFIRRNADGGWYRE